MSNRCNFLYLEAEFKKYLLAGKAEASTIKNYASDIHYFFSWLQNSIQRSDFDYSELPDVFSSSYISQFQEYLVSQVHAQNTTVRRLATLKKFFTFCINQRWLTSNPATELQTRVKGDSHRHLLDTYKTTLLERGLNNTETERQINVISDLLNHYNLL